MIKKTFFLSLFISVFILEAHTQVKIWGSLRNATAEAPIPGAILELESDSLGFVLPRVELEDTYSKNPIDDATEMDELTGTLVYNTATAGSGDSAVSPGVYYNNGSLWIRLEGIGEFPAPVLMKWFYMPTVVLETTIGGPYTVDLYKEFKRQFKFSAQDGVIPASRIVSSDGTPNPDIWNPLPAADEFIYYVTDYDPDVFSIDTDGLTEQGVLTYSIIGTPTTKTYINAVLVPKH